METKHTYTPQGTCSRLIEFTLDGTVVRDLRFTGGCHGNTQGVAALVEGRRPRRRSAAWRASTAAARAPRVPTSSPGRCAKR